MSAPLPALALLRALVEREAGSRWLWLRLLLLIAAGAGVAWMAGTWQTHHRGDEPTGAAVNALLHFEYTALYLSGLLAAVRVMLRLEGDSSAGWLPQYCAAGMEREVYAAVLLVAVAGVALADYLVMALAFAAGMHAFTGSPAGWHQVAVVVLTTPLWLLALCSLAMLCQLITARSSAAILLFAGILLLPFVTAVYAMVDQPPEIPLYVKLVTLTIPTPALRTTPRVLLHLFAYAAVMGTLLLPLANRRIGRTA